MAATMRQIAREAGVNPSTVSRVLSGGAQKGRIAPETAERVKAVALRLGYRPNLAARSLRTRRTNTLGLLVTELDNPFFATIAGAVESAASATGYSTIIATSGEDADREAEYLSVLRSRPTDGLIVAPAPGRRAADALRELARTGFPLVIIDRKIPRLAADRVLTDNRGGAAELVAALVALGCRRPAMAAGPEETWTGAERLAGFREGLRAAGLNAARGLVRSGSFSIETGRRAAQAFLRAKNPPDAIVAGNNRILMGVLEALEAAGEKARNVAAAGFDGVPFAGLLGRPVVVAEQPRAEIGRRAAGMLIERIEGRKGKAREVVLPVRVRTFK